jgi:hypothetical protein
MFGRKKKAAADEADVATTDAETTDDVAADDGEDILVDDDATDDVDESDADEDDDAEEALDDEEPLDEWEELDASRDWRYDGPFDIDEVDLDADHVERLDFGTVIVTPFDGMKLQLQVEQATGNVQALLVMHEQSAIEVALFAAPSHTSMLVDVRHDMSRATEQAGGTMDLVAGPFGTEIRRVLPVPMPDGKQGLAATRTWLAEGPRWMLRGVLMGKAATIEGQDGPVEMLYEFFCNLVVRRGEEPRVPSQLIPMTMPASLVPAPAAQE